MRIVFINLQSNHLILKGMKTIRLHMNIPTKYTDFLKGLLESDNVEVCNLITKKGSTQIPQKYGFFFPLLFFRNEADIVFKYNGIAKEKITYITDFRDIAPDDIVIGFIHSKGGCDGLENIVGQKYLHINQYQCHRIDIEEEKKWDLKGYISEVDLLHNRGLFADKHLKMDKKMIILPFIVAPRFKRNTNYHNRKNKALATGTLSIISNEEYIDYYKSPYFHKMRIEIYKNMNKLQSTIDSLIMPYKEDTKSFCITQKDTIFMKYVKTFCNAIFYGQQKKYFSYNLVDKYNEYTMAVVPEESIGLPAIGAFEAMACGCAYIGIDHKMYRDLGLIPNFHYITYDGTVDGLKKTIEYYQVNSEATEMIAENGYHYVHEKMNKKTVIQNFLSQICSNSTM